jgi:hypothetical protein
LHPPRSADVRCSSSKRVARGRSHGLDCAPEVLWAASRTGPRPGRAIADDLQQIVVVKERRLQCSFYVDGCLPGYRGSRRGTDAERTAARAHTEPKAARPGMPRGGWSRRRASARRRGGSQRLPGGIPLMVGNISGRKWADRGAYLCGGRSRSQECPSWPIHASRCRRDRSSPLRRPAAPHDALRRARLFADRYCVRHRPDRTLDRPSRWSARRAGRATGTARIDAITSRCPPAPGPSCAARSARWTRSPRPCWPR